MNALKKIVKKTPLIFPLIKLKSLFYKYSSQSNEQEILCRLAAKYKLTKNFIEFGFSGWEFNTILLAKTWDGFLADSDPYNVLIAKTLFKKNITAETHWLTLENLYIFKEWLGNKKLGILSIDVDGNDFWFLESLISLNPEVVSVEYNPSFKLHPITVPYDKDFDRTKKHPDWIYYGMSLEAAHRFLSVKNYSLVEISSNCVNAFFVRNDLIQNSADIIFPHIKHLDYKWPQGFSTDLNWKKVSNYEFIEINRDATYIGTHKATKTKV